MLTSKIQQLAEMKAKAAALEMEIAAEMKTELAALPAHYGFESVATFTAAVQKAAGATKGARPAAKSKTTTRRKRARITDEMRATVKQLLDEGKTGAEIAQTLKISHPTVHNIKKALGLVRSRT